MRVVSTCNLLEMSELFRVLRRRITPFISVAKDASWLLWKGTLLLQARPSEVDHQKGRLPITVTPELVKTLRILVKFYFYFNRNGQLDERWLEKCTPSRVVRLTSHFLSSKYLSAVDVLSVLWAFLSPIELAEFRNDRRYNYVVLFAFIRRLEKLELGSTVYVLVTPTCMARVESLNRWRPCDADPKAITCNRTGWRIYWHMQASIIHTWLSDIVLRVALAWSPKLNWRPSYSLRPNPHAIARLARQWAWSIGISLSTFSSREVSRLLSHVLYTTRAQIYGSADVLLRAAFYRHILSSLVRCQNENLDVVFDNIVVNTMKHFAVKFEVKRVFLKKASQPEKWPAVISWKYASHIADQFNMSRGQIPPIVMASPFKVVGYRLINYVPVEIFFPMKLYYECFKKQYLTMWSYQIDMRLARDGVLHLTSAGLWNYRALLASVFSTNSQGSVNLPSEWATWGYDINAFFDHTNNIPPLFRESLSKYLQMTKLTDMSGVAVQGLYFSSWINSYSLAISIQTYLRKIGALGRVIVVVYVDNIQVFAPENMREQVTAALHEAVAFIGCTMKEDAGFCSWKNPLAPLDQIITRDNTVRQMETWRASYSNPYTSYSSDLLTNYRYGRTTWYNASIESVDLWNASASELSWMKRD
jgi:hypothetical protein